MNLRKYSTIENGVYIVKLVTTDWSDVDRQLMVRFGEPEIELGGTFDGSNEVTYELDADLAHIMTDSPFTQRFDSRDYADAENRADLWKTTMSTRIADAVTTLRNLATAWVKEETQTI